MIDLIFRDDFSIEQGEDKDYLVSIYDENNALIDTDNFTFIYRVRKEKRSTQNLIEKTDAVTADAGVATIPFEKLDTVSMESGTLYQELRAINELGKEKVIMEGDFLLGISTTK